MLTPSLRIGEHRSLRSTQEGEEEGKRREGEEEEEEETYVVQLAAIRLCRFTVVRENPPIFAVIKKNVAAITPLGDFDMRPYVKPSPLNNYISQWRIHSVKEGGVHCLSDLGEVHVALRGDVRGVFSSRRRGVWGASPKKILGK